MSNQFHGNTFVVVKLIGGLKEGTKIVAFSFFKGAVETGSPVITVGEGDFDCDHISDSLPGPIHGGQCCQIPHSCYRDRRSGS